MQTERQTVDPGQTGVAVRSGSTLPRSVRPKALESEEVFCTLKSGH